MWSGEGVWCEVGVGYEGGDVRCSVLGLPPALGWAEVVFIVVAAAALGLFIFCFPIYIVGHGARSLVGHEVRD